MRKCKMRLGRLVLIDIEGVYYEQFDHTDKENFDLVAGASVDKEGNFVHIFFEPCSATLLFETLKDETEVKEELEIEVYALEGKEIKEKLYAFEGTLLDCLEIAAKEAEKYDV